MKRTLLSLIAGALIGVTGTLATVEVMGGWWDYRMADSQDEARVYVTSRGWHVVPNQPNPLHLRRARLHS